ncbi:MAG: tetratricopeptide repeat protein [Acidobacteriia bacterium]|nr:tetratricopeptide repeat protein [Terriglobia bacterium]
MRTRWVLFFGASMFAGALGGALLGPAPAGAVAREIIELQTGVNQIIQGQQAMQTAITQNAAVQQTLIQQSLDAVSKLNVSMSAVQKNTQDFSAASGARLDTMGTQVQGLSDNVADLQARLGKLDQKLTDMQNTLQSVDSKLASPAPGPSAPSPATMAPSGGPTPGPSASMPSPSAPMSSAAPPASADVLYSNGLRDINGKHYDLATQEFQDYMKFYGDTDLASNAQFYLGEIAYMQSQYQVALDYYNKVVEKYPRSFKTASARMRKGFCLAELGQKTAAVRELRAVVHNYPGTEEARRSAAKLKEMGATAG